jgi:hypothetical protein
LPEGTVPGAATRRSSASLHPSEAVKRGKILGQAPRAYRAYAPSLTIPFFGAMGRRFEFRQVRVRFTGMQPVLDFERVRQQRGSSTALTAPGLVRQAKRTE